MKYTRYDLKRKERTSSCFLLCLIGVLIGSVIIGTAVFKTFFQRINSTIKITDSTDSKYNADSNKKTDFTLVQCGVFSKKENAEELMTQLKKIGIPFETEESNKIRVFYGIYSSSEEAKAAASQLNNNKFDQDNITISIYNENNCDAQIIDIVNADLEVFNKLSDSKVKSIGTDDLKKWVNKLKKIEQAYKNDVVLKELKTYVNKLPSKVTKENIQDNKMFIYKELKKCTK